MVSAARTTATTPALRVPTTTTRTLVGRAFHTSSPVLLLIVARVLWTARPPARPALGAEATMAEPAGPMTFRCRPPCAPPALRGTETGDHSSEQGLRRITSPIRKEAQPVLFAPIYWLLRRMIGWAGSCLASAGRRQRIERQRRRRRQLLQIPAQVAVAVQQGVGEQPSRERVVELCGRVAVGGQ